jgi:hypothetical protein
MGSPEPNGVPKSASGENPLVRTQEPDNFLLLGGDRLGLLLVLLKCSSCREKYSYFLSLLWCWERVILVCLFFRLPW